MKVLALPIEMVSYTDKKGYIKPIRFRMQIDDEPMQVIKLVEIRYEISTCKWVLFKI